MPWHPVAACWVALEDRASKGLPAFDSQTSKHRGRHTQVARRTPLSTTLMFWLEWRTFLRRQLQMRPRFCRKPAHFRRRSGTRVDRRTTDLRHRNSASLVRHWPDKFGREVFCVYVVVSLIIWVFTSCHYRK